MRRVRGEWCCAGLALVLMTAAAEEQPPPEEAPDMELLEFLGAWDAGDGQWVDPQRFETAGDEEDEIRRQGDGHDE